MFALDGSPGDSTAERGLGVGHRPPSTPPLSRVWARFAGTGFTIFRGRLVGGPGMTCWVDRYQIPDWRAALADGSAEVCVRCPAG